MGAGDGTAEGEGEAWLTLIRCQIKLGLLDQRPRTSPVVYGCKLQKVQLQSRVSPSSQLSQPLFSGSTSMQNPSKLMHQQGGAVVITATHFFRDEGDFRGSAVVIVCQLKPVFVSASEFCVVRLVPNFLSLQKSFEDRDRLRV